MGLKQLAALDNERHRDRVDQSRADSLTPVIGLHSDQAQFRGFWKMTVHQRNTYHLAVDNGEE